MNSSTTVPIGIDGNIDTKNSDLQPSLETAGWLSVAGPRRTARRRLVVTEFSVTIQFESAPKAFALVTRLRLRISVLVGSVADQSVSTPHADIEMNCCCAI